MILTASLKKYFEALVTQPFFDIFSSSWAVFNSTESEVFKTVLKIKILI